MSAPGELERFFFTGCSLHCVFCQNHSISAEGVGYAVSTQRLSELCLALQREGAACIDLVTGTPYTLSIIEAVQEAKKQGLTIPICWNSSGYERVETLRLLEETVSCWMPDMKYWFTDSAKKYSCREDYPSVAREAIQEMVRQQPHLVFSSEGVLKAGVLVRHLVLPNHLIESKLILKWLSENFGNSVQISLMRQYCPTWKASLYPEINRRVSDSEYHSLVQYCRQLGLEQVYTQEKSEEPPQTPEFDGTGII